MLLFFLYMYIRGYESHVKNWYVVNVIPPEISCLAPVVVPTN
jgi:hypothetical protein